MHRFVLDNADRSLSTPPTNRHSKRVAKTTSKKRGVKRSLTQLVQSEKTLSEQKAALREMINNNTVTFRILSNFPSSLYNENLHYPFDSSGNVLFDGELVVCRIATAKDENKNPIQFCNSIYKYIKNTGFRGITTHIQKHHSIVWKASEESKKAILKGKCYKYNTDELGPVPVQDIKATLSKMLAKGLCCSLRPFTTAEDYWVAEIASYFSALGAQYGSFSPKVISDAVKYLFCFVSFCFVLFCFILFGFF